MFSYGCNDDCSSKQGWDDAPGTRHLRPDGTEYVSHSHCAVCHGFCGKWTPPPCCFNADGTPKDR